MNRWTWGAQLLVGFVLAGVVLGGVCAPTAFADTVDDTTAMPIYATNVQKCEDPSALTDGIAVYSDKLVGLEWQCVADKKPLALGGPAVKLRCNAEGTDYKATYQLTGTTSAAHLLAHGNTTQKTRLIYCAERKKHAAEDGTMYTAWPTVSVADAVTESSPGSITLLSHEDEAGRKYVGHSFEATQGALLTIELVSTDFTPLLVVRGPGMDATRACTTPESRATLQFRVPHSGKYNVFVASEPPGAIGDYTLMKVNH